MKNNWISVKERLPEIIDGKDYSENVLAVINNTLFIMCYCFIDNGWVWTNCYGNIEEEGIFDDDYYPTHWQPLPELPNVNDYIMECKHKYVYKNNDSFYYSASRYSFKYIYIDYFFCEKCLSEKEIKKEVLVYSHEIPDSLPDWAKTITKKNIGYE